MNKKPLLVSVALAAALSSAELLSAVPKIPLVEPAFAQEKFDYKHTINVAGRQRMITQRMSKELLLLALGHNQRENQRNLRYNSKKFDRILKGLRYGDPELALQGTEDAEVLASLARVEQLWPLFHEALQEATSSAEAAGDSVGLVSDISLPLLAAMTDTVSAYKNAAKRGGVFTMLEIAIDQADRQRMLIEKMSKDFLLIAYNESPQKQRRELSRSMQLFEATLQGLMVGDYEQRLMPPPNQQILAQLKSVNSLWRELKPILQTALASRNIDPEDIADLASLDTTLMSELDAVVGLYARL
ncbi:MAG: type IV pili methyl-accepting chemotaxis transducer N-terminal domain-containing protein [Kiloniellales bacterium]|nr:type IV pili methyl-accepting chemotaxis transducer N-terminal domain-containing protein [Kiloniellales bacterium]